jgi:four helix bundle protein
LDKIDIQKRAFKFGTEIIKFVNLFPKTPAGFALGNQVVRSGTSIGANIFEAQSASTKKEFIYCLNISLKESRETKYWIELSQETNIVINFNYTFLTKEIEELIKILVTIIKNTKNNLNLKNSEF